MSSDPDSDVPRFMRMYPPPDITPSEFEQFVVDIFNAVEPSVDHVEVTLHDRVLASDGSYDLDGTVRLQWGGLAFVVVLEAKCHKDPIKREFVQVLHSKVQSIGAHKGVLVATSRFQSGALSYAKAHGIALVTVTEGRFTIETKAASPTPFASRERARELFGVPTFVGHTYRGGDSPESTGVTLVSTDHPDLIRSALLGLPDELPSS